MGAHTSLEVKHHSQTFPSPLCDLLFSPALESPNYQPSFCPWPWRKPHRPALLEVKAGMEEGQGPLTPSLPPAGLVWYFFLWLPGAIKNKEPARDKGSAVETALESQTRAVSHCALQLLEVTHKGRHREGGVEGREEVLDRRILSSSG